MHPTPKHLYGDEIVHAIRKLVGTCNRLVVGSNPTSRAMKEAKSYAIDLNYESSSRDPLLAHIDAEIEAIGTSIHFGYIVAHGQWQNTFRNYVGPARVGIHLASSHSNVTIPNPSELIRYYDSSNLNRTSLSLTLIAMRNAVTQVYERIEDHCDNASLKEIWEEAPWRPFARVVRNAFKHDFRFDFLNKRDGTLRDDVSFTAKDGRVFTLSKKLHGQLATGNELSFEAIMELLEVMREFVIALIARRP